MVRQNVLRLGTAQVDLELRYSWHRDGSVLRTILDNFRVVNVVHFFVHGFNDKLHFLG